MTSSVLVRSDRHRVSIEGPHASQNSMYAEVVFTNVATTSCYGSLCLNQFKIQFFSHISHVWSAQWSTVLVLWCHHANWHEIFERPPHPCQGKWWKIADQAPAREHRHAHILCPVLPSLSGILCTCKSRRVQVLGCPGSAKPIQTLLLLLKDWQFGSGHKKCNKEP